MTEIVPSVSIENLLNKRQAILERFEALRENMREASVLHDSLCLDDSFANLFLGSYSSRGRPEFLLLEKTGAEDFLTLFTRRLDAQLWNKLIHESGLRTFMDSRGREDWADAIRKCNVIPFNLDNIKATLGGLHDQRGEMMERGVVEVFQRLSWNYKTNQPVKFGKKIIIDHLFDTWQTSRDLYLCTHRENAINDLERVFRIMDGKPELDHRASAAWAIRSHARNGHSFFELEYFSIRGHKKGTGHLSFHRADLVETLNKILARHYPNALPPR